jgi:hypothetical protein
MSDRQKNKKVVEELADFTDRLLESEQLADRSLPEANGNLTQLKETVRSIAGFAQDKNLDLVLKNRIRANLAAKWQVDGPKPRNNPEVSHFRKPQRVFTSILFIAIVVLLVVIMLASPAGPIVTPGTAQSSGFAGFIIIFGLVIITLIVWRSKKKP